MKYFFCLLLLLVQCSQPAEELLNVETSDNVTADPTTTPATAEEAALHGVTNWAVDRSMEEETCNQLIESGQEDRCLILKGITRLEKEQWSRLFPNTFFYQIRFHQRTQDEFTDQVNSRLFIAWQDGRRYGPGNYDELLALNEIDITDDNRELVAQAFALMTLPDYLTNEIIFNKWESGEWDGRHRYTHRLVGWTRLEGLNVNWWFQFNDGNLRLATRAAVANAHTGDYTAAPFEISNALGLIDYTFGP